MLRTFALALLVALLPACTSSRLDAVTPKQRTDFSGFMVVTSHGAASDAGAEILRRGGNAVDAAVAVQTMLGLVEPESSGLGGGAFILYRDAKTGAITTYDGRETAPSATKPGQFLGADGKPGIDQLFGGESVGVPGVMPMLALAHKEHGKLAWSTLFDPAIKLASDGFTIDSHLGDLLARFPDLKSWPGLGQYLFGAAGEPLPTGTQVRNMDYVRTLRVLAENPRALNEGPIAEDIIEAARTSQQNPQVLTPKDLASYEPKKREPVCGRYREYTVCGMGPPSSGGITVLQVLTMLERFPLGDLGPENPASWHLIAEAERLAFADRARYIADADMVGVPIKGLIDRDYLKARSALIDPDKAAGPREAGTPPAKTASLAPPSPQHDRPSTSHFTIVDKDGNVVAMTSSIQLSFGSRIFVAGFLLNNELTDFSPIPEVNGRRVANAAAPGKRPLSSMSPTIVLDRDGKLVLAVGSPGGIRIIGFVVKTLVASLDWNMTIQDAIDLPNFDNLNGKTEIEAVPGTETLKAALEAKGHEIANLQTTSSLQGFRVVPGGYDGGTDKRRDGKIAGERPLSSWPHLRF